VNEEYFSVIMLIERLHKLYLEVLKAELDRMKTVDITNIQSLILYNIGHERLSVGELTNRGYYLGSNITYNLKKMVDNGYLIQESSPHDRRSSFVFLSDKGLLLYDELAKIFVRHGANLAHNNLQDADFKQLVTLMERLESFWSFMVTRDFRL
jgi:DNA-binding MarR family transcriptional regulator